MKVLILAGGTGTRLRARVPDLPKPMAPIGARPFLAYLLDHLAAAGFVDVTLSVGYMAAAIREYFGAGYRGVRLSYSEEASALGTGGAIRQALAGSGDTPYLVMNGDTLADIDYRALIERQRARPGHLAIALRRVDDCARYGAATVRDQVLTGFSEKGGTGPGLVNTGNYIVTERHLLAAPPSPFSFETDFLQPHCGVLLPGVVISDGYFIDIGIPADFDRAQSQIPLWAAARGE